MAAGCLKPEPAVRLQSTFSSSRQRIICVGIRWVSSESSGNAKAAVLAKALDTATGQLLDNGKSPSRKVMELDNRGSHFYLALYWAQALAAQDEDAGLKEKFAPLAEALSSKESQIVEELNSAQGSSMELGGYYFPDEALVAKSMRPSATFNEILGTL